MSRYPSSHCYVFGDIFDTRGLMTPDVSYNEGERVGSIRDMYANNRTL